MYHSGLGYPSSLTQTIIEDKSLIIYRPKLNQITGGVLPTILLHQIIYWASKKKNLFYKFKEPCNHDLYVPSDSWTEELGFTRWEFEGAIKSIAKKYNPKKEEIPTDSYVVFYTDIRRLTWYSVNWNKLNTAIEEVFIRKEEIPLYVKQDSNFTYRDNSTLDNIDTKNTTQNTQQTTGTSTFVESKSTHSEENADAVLLLGKYGINHDKANDYALKFSLQFIEKKLKEIEMKFVKGSINNLQGYIITVFDKTSSEESVKEQEHNQKKELTKKQQIEAEILAKKKSQQEDRIYHEYISITDKLISEVNVVEQRWFADWIQNENRQVYDMYKKNGLKGVMVETYYRRYLYDKYYKIESGE